MRSSLVAFAVLVLAALALLGCDGTHLAGTHDVELDYEVRKTGDGVAAAARASVEARLGAAHIPADVEPVGATHLRVTVDRDGAEATDEMLTWRGGLDVYTTAPEYAYAPRDPAGLVAKTETAKGGAGGIERYFVGPRARVTRALNEGSTDPAYALLLDPVDAETARVRVVAAPAMIQLRDVVDFTATESDRRDLVLYVRDAPKLRAAIDAIGERPTVIALGRTVLSRRPLAELLVAAHGPAARPALVLHIGDGITAFSRAHNLRSLLRSGTLPPLARQDAQAAAVRWPLAIGCLVVPLVLSFAWLFFVRRFDRAYPEPWWLVLATFALGGLSVVPAGFAEWAMMTATPYLNPSVMTLGGKLSAFPIALAVFTVVVGLSEEGGKLLGTLALAARRPEFDEPVDGIVYGAASSLGFAAVENIKYFAFGRMGSAIITARMFTSIPAHLFFGAIWGYALGKKLVSRRTSVLLFLGYAALMHGAFDTLLSIEGLQLLALVLNLALASLFIVLLRRALRHGAIGPGDTEAPPSANRAFFPVGRPALFGLAALGLHVCAAVLFVLGAGHQALHQKISYAFVVFSGSLVAMLGMCAYALAATMPLDVAVDEDGVTFAGRAVRWSAIRGVILVRVGGVVGDLALVRLERDGGVTHMGPGRFDRMQALERMIAARLAQRS